MDIHNETDVMADLFRVHSRRIYAFLYRLVGDRERCEELTQDCFLVCHRRLVESPPDDPLLFLYGVARNLAREERRRRGRQRQLFEDTAETVLPEQADRHAHSQLTRVSDSQRAALVRKAILDLAEDLRTPLVLREYEGRSYSEIAMIVEIPVGTVRSRLFRARRELAERLLPILGFEREV